MGWGRNSGASGEPAKLLSKGESELQSGVKRAEDLEPGHLGPVLTDFLCDLGTVLHLSEPRFLIYKTGKK